MTNEADGDRYTSPEAYEDAIFLEALADGCFSVYRYKGGVNQKEVKEFRGFSEAAIDAIHDQTALVYAVSKQGRSALIPRARWKHFNHVERDTAKR